MAEPAGRLVMVKQGEDTSLGETGPAKTEANAYNGDFSKQFIICYFIEDGLKLREKSYGNAG